MWRNLLLSISFILTWAVLTPAALAERRVALVIGNSAYKFAGELANPRNDAEDIARELTRLGFEVVKGIDLAKALMDVTVRDYAIKLAGADTGLFFYAGHALQVGGVNYLAPIDAALTTAASLDFEMVRLDLIQRTMEREVKTNILFLDACRDNPLARNLARAMGTRSGGIGRGLAAIESGAGTLIGFSTQPGNVALDGDGRNSPYTSALIKQLRASREDLSTLLIGVRNDVMTTTRERQIPWEHSALRQRFYFAKPDPAAAQPAALPGLPALPPPSPDDPRADLAYWEAVRDSKDLDLVQSYLDQFPRGRFLPLAKALTDRLRADRDKERQASAARDAEALRKAEEAAKQAKSGEQVKLALGTPAPKPGADAAPVDRSTLVRGLQSELKRVGCDPGSIDGQWGAKARRALSDFARHAKVALPLDEPSESARDAVVQRQGRVCPIECDDDEVERDGRCVAVAPVSKPKAKATAKSRADDDDDDPPPKKKSERDKVTTTKKSTAEAKPAPAPKPKPASPPPSPPASSSSGGGGMCWSPTGREGIRPCSELGSRGSRAY